VTKPKTAKPAAAPRTPTAAQAGKIKVRVKQAHEETLPGGGFKRRTVGQEIEIDKKDFAANLHEKIILEKAEGRQEGGINGTTH